MGLFGIGFSYGHGNAGGFDDRKRGEYQLTGLVRVVLWAGWRMGGRVCGRAVGRSGLWMGGLAHERTGAWAGEEFVVGLSLEAPGDKPIINSDSSFLFLFYGDHQS